MSRTTRALVAVAAFSATVGALSAGAQDEAARTGTAEGVPGNQDREPVPGKKARDEMLKVLHKTYPQSYADRTPKGVRSLAKRLLTTGIGTQRDMLERYVLLSEAMRLASKVGESVVAFGAIEGLAATHEIDLAAEYGDVLKGLDRSVKTPEAARSYAGKCIEAVEKLSREGEKETVVRLLRSAKAASRRSRDPNLVIRVKETAEWYKEYSSQKEKLPKLELALSVTPDDPKLNMELGIFRCFLEGNWDEGLPLLAKAKDKYFQASALADLAAEDPESLMAAAEGWMKLSRRSKRTPTYQRNAWKARALEQYRRAWPKLSGLGKDRSRSAIKELQYRINPRASSPMKAIPFHGTKATASEALLDDLLANSGQYSVRITGVENGPSLVSPRIPIAGGKKYALRVWVFTEEKGNGTPIFVRLWEGNTYTFLNLHVPPDQPYWAPVERTFEAPLGCTEMTIRLSPDFKQGYIWYDDISLKNVEEGRELLTDTSFEP